MMKYCVSAEIPCIKVGAAILVVGTLQYSFRGLHTLLVGRPIQLERLDIGQAAGHEGSPTLLARQSGLHTSGNNEGHDIEMTGTGQKIQYYG